MSNKVEQLFGKEVKEGHLGGCFLGGDPSTYYPKMWEYLVKKYSIESVVDIGAGGGHSTKYFADLGCEVIGVDGSVEASENFTLPESFLLNDYSVGSAITDERLGVGDEPLPEVVFDLAWSCEFVEHVYEQFSDNFLADFARCKYIAITFAGPGQDGYHHVNLQPASYWIDKIEALGYTYLAAETEELKEYARQDYNDLLSSSDLRLPWNNKTLEEGLDMHYVDRGLFFVRN